MRTKKPEVVSGLEPIFIASNGSILDSVEWERFEMDLDKFVKELSSGAYDVSVVFQREKVWNRWMAGNLIRSIFVGAPIGDCLLCEKPHNVAHANVIDFKNRSLAILDFWLGEFSVPFTLADDKGNEITKELSWPQIENSPDPQLQNLRKKFANYKVRGVSYKGMTIVQQAKRYIINNLQIPMVNEELLYGENFWVKGLFRGVYDYCLQNILKHIRGKEEKDNVHEKGTIFAHRLCYICFGPLFNDVWAIRDLGNSKTTSKTLKPMVRDAKSLNDFLGEELEKNKTHTLDLDFIKKLSFWEKIDLLKKTCNAVADILWYNNPTDKNQNKNDVFDSIIFFMKNIMENRLTLAMMRDNKSVLLGVITDFVDEKGSDKTMTGQSVTTKKIKEREEIFEKCLKKSGLDLELKNKQPSSNEVALAFLKSGTNCPITGEAIGRHNSQVEHESPKCKSSSTKYTITSATGNGWKGCNTPEELKALENYHKEANKDSV